MVTVRAGDASKHGLLTDFILDAFCLLVTKPKNTYLPQFSGFNFCT